MECRNSEHTESQRSSFSRRMQCTVQWKSGDAHDDLSTTNTELTVRDESQARVLQRGTGATTSSQFGTQRNPPQRELALTSLQRNRIMKTFRIAGVATVALLAACTAETATGPGQSAPRASATTAKSGQAQSSHDEGRPFAGRCSTALTALSPLPNDGPNVLRLRIDYDCQLLHLGRTTAVAQQTVIFTGPTTAIAWNSTTYTAANGDRLFATWSGTSTSTGADVVFSGRELYSGGTGRFSAASGSAWIAGTASFADFKGEFTTAGTLRYGAAALTP